MPRLEILLPSQQSLTMKLQTKTFLATVIAAMSLTSLMQAQTVYQFSTSISSSTWLTPGNWTVGPGGPVSTVFPGLDASATTTTNGTATDIAAFGSLTSATPASNGINFNTAGGALTLGTIELLSSANRAVSIGNSSGAAGQPNPALLTLTGQTVNAIANTILTNDSTFGLTLKPFQGGSVAPMNVVLGNATDNVVQLNSTGGIVVSSVVQDGSSASHLTVSGTGSGALTLSGANTYTGGTTVSSANLAVTNTTGSATGTGAVNVSGTGILSGNGFINVGANRVTIFNGATLAPTAAVAPAGLSITGTQTTASVGYTSTLNLQAASTFRLTLSSATTFSSVNLTGTVDVTGSTLAVDIVGVFAPAVGSSFLVVNNDSTDSITGIFAQGAAVTASNGQIFGINYGGGDGNDLVLTTLTAVPEPATYMLIGVGVLVCAQQFRRRKNS